MVGPNPNIGGVGSSASTGPITNAPQTNNKNAKKKAPAKKDAFGQTATPERSTRISQAQHEYLKEKEMLDEMFFNAYFDVSMDIKALDDLVSDKKEIIIQQEFKCYCYKNLPTDNKIFTIRGDKLTKKYVIEDLIK